MAIFHDNYINENKDWNMDMYFLRRLDMRLNETNLASIEGDLLRWYRGLRIVYRMVLFKVRQKGHEEEEENLEKQFNKVHIYFKNSTMVKSQALYKSFITEAEDLLDDIDSKLSVLLHEYGFIYPKKSKKDLDKAFEVE